LTAEDAGDGSPVWSWTEVLSSCVVNRRSWRHFGGFYDTFYANWSI